MLIKKPISLVSFIFLALISTSCSSNNNPQKPDTKKVQKTVDIDPCNVLNEEIISKFIEIDEASLDKRDSEVGGNKMCVYVWDKPNKEEIEAEYKEVMMQYIKDKAAGKEVKIPIMQTSNRVTITINTPISDSRDASLSKFESAMKILRDGITVTVSGKEHTTRSRELEAVSGVGDKANWVPSLNQISVVGKNTIFHVTVEIGNKESNKKYATEMAKLALKEL